jgi:hypothetical protein
MGWDWTHLARLGLILGAEAVRVYGSIAPSAIEHGDGLAVVRSTLDLPPLLPVSIAVGQEMATALKAERTQLAAAGAAGALWWAEARLDRVRRGVEALQGGRPVPPIRAELCALRLGRAVALATAPGEIFNEIGQSVVAHSPFPRTLFAGYTNGSVWYVPTRAAYAEGGYEVTHACRVSPEAGELLEAESIRLLGNAIG